jgi:hypothetical protein
MSKQQHPYIEKLLRFRIIMLIGFLFLLFLFMGVFFSIDTGHNYTDKNKENFYQTWKCVRYYHNGKLVVNDEKFQNLRIKINHDSTAEWIRPNGTQKYRSWINEDASELVKIDPESNIPEVDHVYEIRKDRLRFGRRNVMTHNEYVLVPE